MANNFMFSCLNPVESKSVLDALRPVSAKAGDMIIKQGDDGDHFYLVEQGVLMCSKVFEGEEHETPLREYTAGEAFGELALLYNSPRAATIVCKSDICKLWSLDRRTFSCMIKSAVQRKRARYDQFLSQVEILKCMDRTERSRMADSFKEEWFVDGDTIINEGEQGDRFYMIMEGTCEALKKLSPNELPVSVRMYQPGDYFGERALLRDRPRAASIVVRSARVCAVSLDRPAFKRLMGPLQKILARNEDDYNRLMNSPVKTQEKD